MKPVLIAMTSRERLLSAYRREVPDTVLVHFHGFNPWADGWEARDPSFSRLITFARENVDALGLWEPVPKNEVAFLSATHRLEVEEKHWDEGDFTFSRKVLHTLKGPLQTITKTARSIYTTWTVEHFLKSAEDIERFLSVDYEPIEWDISTFYDMERRMGGKGIMFIGFPDPLCTVAELFHFGDFTIQALLERERFKRMLDVMWERVQGRLRACLDAGLGPVYRIYGPEYATPPYLPPSCFEEYVVPYDKKMVEMIHEKGFFVQLHSHGKVAKVLQLMQEISPDAIDPFEPPPGGDIELSEVKRRLGTSITIAGNMEFRDLEVCTPAEIDAKVKAIMDAAKPGGAFILQPTAEPITSPLPKRLEENYDSVRRIGEEVGRLLTSPFSPGKCFPSTTTAAFSPGQTRPPRVGTGRPVA